MKLKNNIAVSDSGFLFNPTAGSSYSVNPVGQRIIELLKSEKSDEEIIEILLNEYFTDKATIEKDLYDFKVLLGNYKLTDKTDE
jgi:hypothetical protein